MIKKFPIVQCTYINGSPQNTFVPGLIEYAEYHGVHIAGDDFKSGESIKISSGNRDRVLTMKFSLY